MGYHVLDISNPRRFRMARLRRQIEGARQLRVPRTIDASTMYRVVPLPDMPHTSGQSFGGSPK